MKTTLLLTICIITFTGCCSLKKLQRESLISTMPSTLILEADDIENPTIDIDFSIHVPEKFVRNSQQLIYQPQFLTVSDYKNLQPVVINGRKMAKKEARMVKRGEAIYLPNAIRVEAGKEPISIDYSLTTDVESWMPESELVSWTMVNCGKRHKNAIINRTVIASGIDMPEIVEIPLRTIIENLIKEFDIIESSYFVINSAEYDPTLGSNSESMAKLKVLMNKIKSNSKFKLHSINIIGSASPDGTDKINGKLAEDRAETIAKMLSSELSIDPSIVSVSSVGANWQGLVEIVENSSLPNKEKIISIANSTEHNDWEKSIELRKLSNYDTIKRDYLPMLRMVQCDVKYTKTTQVTKEVTE